MRGGDTMFTLGFIVLHPVLAFRFHVKGERFARCWSEGICGSNR
jgi:hypothetical protein